MRAFRREQMRVRWKLLAMMTLVSLASATHGAQARRRPQVPSTGLAKIAFAQEAPDFTFQNAGVPTRLSAFAGKPVVLNFWATWCGPCSDEIPVFAQLGKTYGSDVSLIAVSDESFDVTETYLQAHGVRGVAVSDPDRTIFNRYGITPIPVTIVLARDGTVRHVSVGELDWLELRSAIEALSATPAPAASVQLKT